MPRPAPTYSLLPAALTVVVFADAEVPVEVAVDVKEAPDERGLVLEVVPLDAPAVPVGAAVEAQEATVGTVTATARQILLAYAIVSWMSDGEQALETQQDNLEM